MSQRKHIFTAKLHSNRNEINPTEPPVGLLSSFYSLYNRIRMTHFSSVTVYTQLVINRETELTTKCIISKLGNSRMLTQKYGVHKNCDKSWQTIKFMASVNSENSWFSFSLNHSRYSTHRIHGKTAH